MENQNGNGKSFQDRIVEQQKIVVPEQQKVEVHKEEKIEPKHSEKKND